jgi:hypothetical protein
MFSLVGPKSKDQEGNSNTLAEKKVNRLRAAQEASYDAQRRYFTSERFGFSNEQTTITCAYRFFPNSNSEFRRAADCGLPPVPQFARLLAGVRRRRLPGSPLPTLLRHTESVGSLCFFLIYQLILKFIR